jgi:hypothetical protein
MARDAQSQAAVLPMAGLDVHEADHHCYMHADSTQVHRLQTSICYVRLHPHTVVYPLVSCSSAWLCNK